ncbi:MAG: glycosyltransferase family 4 protein [Acetobacteraceae bacterium]|nr:glycosyltransferase family 4 protein [Acetobacteraceae bacterium]
MTQPVPPPPLRPPLVCTAFAAESYPATGGKVMGRQSASTAILRAFIERLGPVQAAYLMLGEREAPAFDLLVKRLGGTQAQCVLPHAIEEVGRYGTLFTGGPDLAQLARRRAMAGAARRFSLCGITHTLSSLGATAAIAAWPASDAQPWDAVICTSEAARAVVRRVLEEELARLAARFGPQRPPLPELPLIPLGIHTANFAPRPGEREAERARLGLGERDVAVLFHGRVSFHAKAHHWPMMAALGRVAPRMPAGARLHLLIAGWTSNEGQERAVRDCAAALCPDVVLHRLPGAEPEAPQPAFWAAADIATLLSDNIQESFGLAPLEALAAGLPVVASDWDGLKETVRHEEDGFRVPTSFPPPGTAPGLGLAHASGAMDYDHFVGHAGQLAAVDVPATADAFAALALDPARRRAMGAAGQARVRREFDWAAIVPRYLELWRELAARREAAPEPRGTLPPDPTRIFAGFPTAPLRPDTVLARDPAAPTLPLPQAAALPSAMIGAPPPRRLARLGALLAAMGEAGASIETVARALPEAERGAVWADCAWLLKTGYARRLG